MNLTYLSLLIVHMEGIKMINRFKDKALNITGGENVIMLVKPDSTVVAYSKPWRNPTKFQLFLGNHLELALMFAWIIASIFSSVVLKESFILLLFSLIVGILSFSPILLLVHLIIPSKISKYRKIKKMLKKGYQPAMEEDKEALVKSKLIEQ